MPSWSILSQCFNERSVILAPQGTQEHLETLQDLEELLSNMHFFFHEANDYFNGMGIIIEGISDIRDDGQLKQTEHQ